jgi:hypothetical protein
VAEDVVAQIGGGALGLAAQVGIAHGLKLASGEQLAVREPPDVVVVGDDERQLVHAAVERDRRHKRPEPGDAYCRLPDSRGSSPLAKLRRQSNAW